ncbi:NAD(P)H-dependent oxidoreductase [Streptomyces sp. NPDC096057]|uniref:NADPH-dependent FMN reductase n=1 Tax=Streptomyces sp. NPDC096057 TaxID=3155543 RepID=UPI00331DD187
MDRRLALLGLGGSTREGSAAEMLLSRTLGVAREAGMRTELFSLGRHDVPVFRESLLVDPPPVVAHLLTAVREADAIVFCSPVYHGTLTGAMKNAVDHLQALAGDERPWLTGKVAGLMAVGGNAIGGANAISAMDHFCRALYATTVPTAVVAAGEALAPDDPRADGTLEERVGRMVRELAVHARASAAAMADSLLGT